MKYFSHQCLFILILPPDTDLSMEGAGGDDGKGVAASGGLCLHELPIFHAGMSPEGG